MILRLWKRNAALDEVIEMEMPLKNVSKIEFIEDKFKIGGEDDK